MAKDKFILVSLKDDEAKKLAQVITNDTSRQILDFLADKESTETEISEVLGIPLPTVHYNLRALTNARLVVCEQFHYSAKGREVNHYKLANKYIIIAPQTTWGLKEKLKSILPMIPILGGAAIALEWFSRTSSLGQRIASSAPEALNGIEESARAAAPESLPHTAQQAAETAIAHAPAISQKATYAVIEHGTPVVHQGASSVQPSTATTILWTHPGLWLLLGALGAVVLYLSVDFIRSKQ